LGFSVEAPGIEPLGEVTIEHESRSNGDPADSGPARSSDPKCATPIYKSPLADDSDDSRQRANPAKLEVGDVVITAIERALAIAIELQQHALTERCWPEVLRRAGEAEQLAAELESRQARRYGAPAGAVVTVQPRRHA
jgi:hypothetical protein